MAEKKKYEHKTFNHDDYKKMEKGADAVRKGGGIALGVVAAGIGVGIKKFGPKILKAIKSIKA